MFFYQLAKNRSLDGLNNGSADQKLKSHFNSLRLEHF